MSGRPNNAKTLQRRHFLAGAAGTLLTPLAVAQTASSAVRVSPSQTLGPFYPRNAAERPAETDADLLRVEGDGTHQGRAHLFDGPRADRCGQPL
jgi:hypothetical protein